MVGKCLFKLEKKYFFIRNIPVSLENLDMQGNAGFIIKIEKNLRISSFIKYKEIVQDILQLH